MCINVCIFRNNRGSNSNSSINIWMMVVVDKIPMARGLEKC